MDLLPNEIIYHIISFLSIRMTMRFLRSCKYLYHMYEVDELLREDVRQKFLTEPELMTLDEALGSDNPLKNLQVIKLRESDYKKIETRNKRMTRVGNHPCIKYEESKNCIIS